MHDRDGLLEMDAMLMQQHPHPLGAQADPGLLGEVTGQQRARPQRLLQPVPAWIVAHRLDQQPFVGLVPGGWPASAPLGRQAGQPVGFKAIQPAMHGGLVHSQQLSDSGHPPAIRRQQDGVAAMHHLDHRAGLVQLGQRRPFLGGQFSDMSQGHDTLRKR